MAMTPGPDMEHDPQLAALYRASADAVPPAHLDDAIRAAARREVAAGPRRAGIRRWAVPVSLAAVLVLSVSVVTMMREQGMDRAETMLESAPPAMTAERAAPPAPVVVEPKALPGRQPAAPAMAPAAPVAPAAPPAPSAASSGRAAEAEQAVPESRAKAAAAEPGSTQDAPAARREYAAPQPLLRSAPPMADAGVGASAAKPAAPAALAAGPGKTALWQDLVREPPEKWLQRIAELRRAGQTADAETLVAEFRRRFPDQRLPEDLR